MPDKPGEATVADTVHYPVACDDELADALQAAALDKFTNDNDHSRFLWEIVSSYEDGMDKDTISTLFNNYTLIVLSAFIFNMWKENRISFGASEDGTLLTMRPFVAAPDDKEEESAQ